MKINLTCFLLSLFIVVYAPISANDSTVVRAALDIGMGGPKLQIAEVDIKTNKIIKPLHTQKFFVNFYEGCVDHKLSSEVMAQGLQAIKRAIEQAHALNAKDIVAIATASFRSASNGLEFAEIIQKETGIKVHVIDQNLEGKLAFQAALSKVDADPENVVVWDIGGGSIQFIAKDEEDTYLVDCGNEGIGRFNDHIIGTVQGRDIKECKTPNPMSFEDIHNAIIYAQNQSQKLSKIFKDKIHHPNTKVIGVGNAFGYGVSSVVGRDAFDLEAIKIAVHHLIGKSDADFGGGEFAFCEGTNVLLACGFMQGLGIDAIQILQINNADGALIYEPFWK